MTQRIPADARLGRTRTKQNIGYRILYLSREEFSPFTVERVGETGIAGWYAVAGGVDAPAAGGYIVWGLETQDIAEEDIKPVPADTSTSLLNRIQAMLETLRANIRGMIPPPAPAPVVRVDTREFESSVTKLHSHVAELVQEGELRQDRKIVEIRQELATVQEFIARLDTLNDNATQLQHLDGAASRFTEMSVALAAIVQANGKVAEATITEQKLQRALGAIDNFLVNVGGQDDE